MAAEFQSVTCSEWKLVHRRLDDLENLVTDLKLKLEILGESVRDATNITADSTATLITGSKLDDPTSVNTSDDGNNGTSVSTKSTLRLSNGIGIHDVEKYRRLEIKLRRCEQVEAKGTSSEFRIATNKSTPTSTNKESHIPSKERPVLRRKGNGVRAEHTSATPLSNEKRFVCHLCSKRFGQKSYLADHIRVHTGDRPFQCNICSKKFTQAAHLKTHAIVHTGSKPFECGFCPKKFGLSSSLTIHTRVHTGVKPYGCGFCSKKFSRRQSLTLHVRSHTGERPYVCQLCSMSFAGVSNLLVHLRVHTREKPYPCSFCSKMFAHSVTLKKHLTRHSRQTQVRNQEESP